MNFSTRFKELRLERNLQQKEIAVALNVHKGTISNWEIGKRTPDTEMLKKISAFFNCSVDYLIGNSDKKIQSSDAITLSSDEKKDITKYVANFKENFLSEDGLMFDGVPASEEAIKSILDAIEIGVEIAKKREKEKHFAEK